jgi:hypothetical protein
MNIEQARCFSCGKTYKSQAPLSPNEVGFCPKCNSEISRLRGKYEPVTQLDTEEARINLHQTLACIHMETIKDFEQEANHQLDKIVARLKTNFENQHVANDKHWEQIVAPLKAKMAELEKEVETAIGAVSMWSAVAGIKAAEIERLSGKLKRASLNTLKHDDCPKPPVEEVK